MSRTIALTLLLFAAISFAGAGIAFAIARAREIGEAEDDLGMRSVAGLLFGFGAICTYLSAGISGIFAFGGVIAWVSYVIAAQRMEVFQIQRWQPLHGSLAERRPIG